MDKYAVFLDIDNTLYCDGAVPERNIEAIKRAREKGHYVFINTARSYGFMPKDLLETVNVDGVVSGIGTDLRFHGEQIFSRSMSVDELYSLVKHFFDNDDGSTVIFEGEEKSLSINCDEWHKDRCLPLTSPGQIYTDYKDIKISKTFFVRDYTDSEREEWGSKYTLFRHKTYSEFVDKGFSKGEGLKRMASLVGVPIEHCIAMGDSANDIDMLKVAGISVAMGDAIDEVKKICTYVSCDCNDGGVGQAIEKFLL